MLLLRQTLLLSVAAFLLACPTSVGSQTSTPMNDHPAVRQVVERFADAVEARDLTALDQLLHPEFRVIATRFPDPETTSILPRKVYLSMIESEKIGGDPYDVVVHGITATDQNATVTATFGGAASDMLLTLLLTQNSEGTWEIISDFPVIRKG